MNEQELKALQLEIKSEQKKQFDAIEAMKKDVGAQNAALLEKYDAASGNIQKLSEQADALALQLKDQKMGGKRENPFSEMKKALTDKSVLSELKKGGQRTFEIKASTIDEATELSNGTTDISGAVIVPFREPGVGKAPDRQVMLLDLVNRGTISSNRVSWVERSARTAGAAAVAQGNQYAQSDMTYIQKFAPVEKIGTFIKVTNEALEDWDQLMSEINMELFPMVERAVEAGVYSGTGTSPALQGITDTGIAAAYTATALSGIITPNIWDAIRAGIMQLSTANFYPTAVFINPVDGAFLDLPKNNDGSYLLPPFAQINGRMISGVKIYESNLVTAGDMLVGDFTKDTLFIKRGIEIKIWDQDSTDPEYDLKTITASVRAVNRIKVPHYDAFVYDTIADVITAIS
jgi:HK97 family phage major capsid protein